MDTKYFGTDGVRGTANTAPITPDMALRIGQAAGQIFKSKSPHVRPTVVIGKDTRLSGYMIESALQAGFTSVGFYTLQVGPLPTPAVAMLTRSLRADLGVMITASHNPFTDNGIKFFTPNGQKLDETCVQKLEEIVDNPELVNLSAPDKIGKAVRLDDASGRYIEFCKNAVPREFSLDGLRIVVDCANGAAYKIAPRIFWEFGAQVVRIGCEPDGFNINRNCGALHPERMAQAVKDHGADLGIALDGDGDRLMLCDENGRILDGDNILAAMAWYMKESGTLKGDKVVGTLMTNMGMEKYLKESLSLGLERTKVGDHYVAANMRENGYNIGGESSGHLIFSDYATTGDGIMAALQFLTAMRLGHKTAAELGDLYSPFPQKLQNVRLPEGVEADKVLDMSEVKSSIESSQEELNGNGRVLIRKSGTEPLIRVMVEAEDQKLVDTHVSKIAETIEEAKKNAQASDIAFT